MGMLFLIARVRSALLLSATEAGYVLLRFVLPMHGFTQLHYLGEWVLVGGHGGGGTV